MQDFSSVYRFRALIALAFFALGQLAAEHVAPLAGVWAFLSPLEWIASLALVITGDALTVQGIMALVTMPDTGILGTLLRAVEAGVVGAMLFHSVTWVASLATGVSLLCGILFQITFLPIWFTLISYKPLSDHFPAFAAAVAPLEGMAPEVRKGLGFGILLLAVTVPLVMVLGAKLLSGILWPEKSYRS